MNSLLYRSVAALLALCVVCSASFSVYITQKGSSARVVQPEGRPLVFRTEAPTAEHVADIYARTTGRPPLLSEGIILWYNVSENRLNYVVFCFQILPTFPFSKLPPAPVKAPAPVLYSLRLRLMQHWICPMTPIYLLWQCAKM